MVKICFFKIQSIYPAISLASDWSAGRWSRPVPAFPILTRDSWYRQSIWNGSWADCGIEHFIRCHCVSIGIVTGRYGPTMNKKSICCEEFLKIHEKILMQNNAF